MYISDWKWGYSIAMLVSEKVYFALFRQHQNRSRSLFNFEEIPEKLKHAKGEPQLCVNSFFNVVISLEKIGLGCIYTPLLVTPIIGSL